MSTLSFPSNPSLNDTYSFGGKTWIYNGSYWALQSTGAINNIPIGNVTPATGAFTTLTSTGNTTLGPINSDLIPTANLAYSLGNATNQWANIYVGGNTIFLGSLQLKDAGGNTLGVYAADGTTPADVAADVNAANIVGTVGLSQYVTEAAQGNITSVGTLTSLSVTGNVTAGNLNINTNAVIAGNLTVQGTETIFNVNTLTVNDKDIVVANNVTGGANVDGSGLLAGNPTVASLLYNNATTSWQTNIGITPSANGTLDLGLTSNRWGNLWVTTLVATGNANVGNIGATTVAATNLSGTLDTASQPNITSIGTLSSLTVTGNISGGNLLVTNNIIDSGALEIITGSNGNITLSPNGTGVIVANKDLRNGQANGVGNIGSSTGYFNTVFAKATSAQYADLAELYLADADYPAGTVVVFGGQNEITQSTTYAQASVAGIVSTNPAYIMNAESNGLPVALQGRVPCRIKGIVRKGDLVTASDIPGVATRLDPQDWVPGSVIGKALGNHDSDAEGVIEVVVGRV